VEDSANRTIPSLAIVAAAACWKPFTTWEYDLEPWQIEMGLVAAETREPQLRTLPITFTDVADADQPHLGVRAGDIVGQFFLQMPPESELLASMLRYEDVMRASPQQLRAWFAGRAVVVGDWRTSGDVRIRHPDGRELPGFAAHAVGLDWLLSERLIRRPRPVPIWKFYIGSKFLAELCVAVVALCLAVLLGRRPSLLAIAAALLAASVLLVSGITFSRTGALYPPQTALIAVLLVVVGAWLVQRWCAGSTLE
jgi:CHASE2 domain-containing sensor protein